MAVRQLLIAWYREMAERYGFEAEQSIRFTITHPDVHMGDRPEREARVAFHFACLVLGYEGLGTNQLIAMQTRSVTESAEARR